MLYVQTETMKYIMIQFHLETNYMIFFFKKRQTVEPECCIVVLRPR